MNTRGLIGKRIVAIRQTRFWNDHLAKMDMDLDAIVLEDGTELRPVVGELECEYCVDMVVVKRAAKTRDKPSRTE